MIEPGNFCIESRYLPTDLGISPKCKEIDDLKKYNIWPSPFKSFSSELMYFWDFVVLVCMHCASMPGSHNDF